MGQETGNEYKAGQVWNYRCKPEDNDSFVVIVKVESDTKLGEIVHIAVGNVHLPNIETGELEKVGILPHFPMSKAAVDKSVGENMANWDLPGLPEGYYLWKEAFDKGEAGIFSIPVNEVIDVVIKMREEARASGKFKRP